MGGQSRLSWSSLGGRKGFSNSFHTDILLWMTTAPQVIEHSPGRQLSTAAIVALSQRNALLGAGMRWFTLLAGFSALGGSKLGRKFPGLGRQRVRGWGSARCPSFLLEKLSEAWHLLHGKTEHFSTLRRICRMRKVFPAQPQHTPVFFYQLRNLPREMGSLSASLLAESSRCQVEPKDSTGNQAVTPCVSEEWEWRPGIRQVRL